tara:strand:+ start:3732 stop:5630 length:1899 start_codon:yes stop_codon:yes gene_type:complete
MASYYKYAERKVENQVDWSAISKGVTESIEAEKISRDGRKAAIDKASNESMIAMMEKPQGEYAKENDRVANFAEQAQSAMLNNSKLLKSGSISEREYSSLVNNLDTGTKMAFNLSKKYQDAYQGHVERMTANKDGVTMGSNLEVDQLAYVESSFGPGANSQYVIAPSGEVQIAQMTKMDEDGEQVQVGPLTSLNGASNMIVQQIDRYQTLGAVEGITDQIGKKIDALIGKENGEGTLGFITTKEDAYKALDKAEEGGSNALELAIRSSFANSDGMASFLSDTLGSTEEGTPYQLLFKGGEAWTKLKKEGGLDKNGMPKDSSFILREQGPQGNWTSKLSTSQEARVIDSMKDLVEQKLDVKETVVKDPYKMNDREIEAARLAREKLKVDKSEKTGGEKSAMSNLTKLFYGGEKDAKAAAQFIRGLDKNENLQIKLEGPNMILTRTLANGSTEVETISKEGGIKNFIESASTFLNLGIDDVQQAMSASGALTDKEGNALVMNPISLDSSSVITKKVTTIDQVQDQINGDIDSITLSKEVVKDEEDLRQALAQTLGKYGVNIEEKVAGSDEVSFTLGEESITVPLKKATPSSIKELVKNLINSDVTKETLIQYKAKLRGRTQDETGSGVGRKYNR